MSNTTACYYFVIPKCDSMCYECSNDRSSSVTNRLYDWVLDCHWKLRQRLSKFFEFVSDPEHTNRKYIIKRIRRQTPNLIQNLSKRELKKLSLLWITVLGCCYDIADLQAYGRAYACHYFNLAERLVRCGADVNELYGLQAEYRQLYLLNEKSTVLHVLIQMYPSLENERLIRLITDHGVDLQARDSLGRTVLLCAVRQNRVQLAEVFLEKGADVNIADNDGLTALLEAASSREADKLLPLLIKYGADVSVQDEQGQNALHWLTRNPNIDRIIDVARILIENGVSLDDREFRYQYQPIHMAVMEGNNELVKLYLDHGANVNALAHDDESPLYLASKCKKQLAVLKTLLERGADVNRRTYFQGRTALHAACQNYTKKSIEILLSAGADMLIENSNGNTPFALLMYCNRSHLTYRCTTVMLKSLVLKKFCQPSIELTDEQIIMMRWPLMNIYRDCIEEIKKTQIMRFIESCTFFELLTKCHCQIAKLMRNPEFESKFKNYDLRQFFFMYVEDIRRAFWRAQSYYHSMLEQEQVISEAVYHVLPYLVVRRVASYIFNCNCENAE